MTGLATIAAVLAELVALLAIAAATFGVLWWRIRKHSFELQARLAQNGREASSYLGQIRDAMQIAIAAHRNRFGSGAEVLHTGKLLKNPQTPDQVALQLRYDFLRHEQKLMEDAAGQQDYWSRRSQAASEVLRSLSEGEEGLRQWWAAQQRKHAEESEKLRHEQAEALKTLNFKVQRRDISVGQLNKRIEELEAYRSRFNMLHGEVLREREANEVLRRRLREQAASLVEQPLQEYQLTRESLDRYLDQSDIAPFADRHAEQRTGTPLVLRARRQRQLVEGTEKRLSSKQQLLKQALAQQNAVIESLREQVEQAEEREERLKAYYQQKVRELQKSAEESRQSAEGLEKEINRSRRTSGHLLQQMERKEQETTANTALEQTIDRFATQAIEMQQRIQTLERDLAQSNTDNLALQTRLEALAGNAVNNAPAATHEAGRTNE